MLRGLFETLLLGSLVLLLLLVLMPQLPPNAFTLGLMYIGAGCAFWFSIRLHLPAGGFWKAITAEVLNTAILGLAVLLILPQVAGISGLYERIGSSVYNDTQFFSLAACIPGYIGLRALNYGWNYWDKLRRRKLIWTLVHNQLSVVVVITVLLSLAGAVLVTVEALRSYPEETLAATIAHRIILTILPFLAVAIAGLGAALLGVLPAAAVAAYFTSRRLIRRLESLTLAAEALRRGDFASRVEVSGEDEVALLQTNFNRMATDLETALAEIQAERDKVAALLESRRTLTASVSHELRTPIATLRGYLEPGTTDQTLPTPEDLAIIQREVANLERLVEDLFNLSQAETQQLSMKIQPTDLKPILHRLAATHAPLAWERGRVELVFQSEDWISKANLDTGRLEQIVTNLLRNALQHTPPGGIVAMGLSQVDDWVQVEVRDTGSGIPPADLELIWERFYRGEKEGSGAGLGLAIVKELTETMGGMVGVESVLKEGSVFWVRFPSV